MRIAVAFSAACLALLAGCGSGGDGLEAPKIGKAKSFELAGFEPTAAVKAGVPTTVSFHIEQPEGGALTKFKTGSGPHTGVHLIIVREDLSQIIHRHPPVAADGTVSQEITFPSAGPWHVLTDVYPDLGPDTLQNFQLTGKVEVSGDYEAEPIGAFKATQTVDGDRFTVKPPATLRELKPQFLDVTVTDAAGKPAKFTPYYGALAHAIFFREGSLAYFHTHVCGAGLAGCASSIGATRVTGKSTAPGKLKVGMLLPDNGRWRLFLQARINGKIVTAPFTMEVK